VNLPPGSAPVVALSGVGALPHGVDDARARFARVAPAISAHPGLLAVAGRFPPSRAL
jgi:hypothetical protein